MSKDQTPPPTTPPPPPTPPADRIIREGQTPIVPKGDKK